MNTMKAFLLERLPIKNTPRPYLVPLLSKKQIEPPVASPARPDLMFKGMCKWLGRENTKKPSRLLWKNYLFPAYSAGFARMAAKMLAAGARLMNRLQ
jgi:hypothetical protein